MSVDTRDMPSAERPPSENAAARPTDGTVHLAMNDPSAGAASALAAASRPAAAGLDAQPSAGAADARGPETTFSNPYSHTPDFLLDVRLTVSVEVGRVQVPVRQLMELGPGSVIELQHNASEPVEVFANGRCIGKGEIVVVGEYFGVRLTELGPAN